MKQPISHPPCTQVGNGWGKFWIKKFNSMDFKLNKPSIDIGAIRYGNNSPSLRGRPMWKRWAAQCMLGLKNSYVICRCCCTISDDADN